MIDVAQLDVAAEKLRVHDAEHEPWWLKSDDFVTNALGALCYMGYATKNTGKKFTNPRTVESLIAPDATRFAIRLGRWTGQANRILVPTPEHPAIVRTLARESAKIPLHQVAFTRAVTTIMGNLYDHANSDKQTEARDGVLFTARSAARHLLYAADLQAEQYDFDLFQTLNLDS